MCKKNYSNTQKKKSVPTYMTKKNYSIIHKEIRKNQKTKEVRRIENVKLLLYLL